MISIILIWIYIFIVSMSLGGLGVMLAQRLVGYDITSVNESEAGNRLIAVVICGLVMSTVYAEIYSLFAGVGLLANVILVVGIIVFVVKKKGEWRHIIASLITPFFKDKVWIVFLVVFFVMSYGTSHGYMHYDTGLYHAQAIKWIEQYGVVPGLGNLHCRLGYNSAAFPLTALFSFAWLGGQSFHVTAGFFALILAWECIGITKNIRTKQFTVSLFVRIMGTYYLLMIFDEMVSPASDYFMVSLAFVLVIRWLDNAESGEDISSFCMLAILACYVLSIKLSGAMFVLCAIAPGIDILKNKRIKKFVACIASGGVIVIPYLIRNVIISGWMLYPSTALDFFYPDWKIAKGSALYDYMEIQVYGRGYSDVSRYDESIIVWFTDWFKLQSLWDKLFIAAAIVGVVFFVVKCIYYGLSMCRLRTLPQGVREMYLEAVLTVCFLFWLFTSPLMRYGCLYVYLVDALIWGRILCKAATRRNLQICITGVIVAFMVYKSGMFAKEVVTGFRTDVLLLQQDYDLYEVTDYKVGDITIYMPVEGDQTGYYAFPSSPWQMDISLRGDEIKDGFITN